MGRKGETPVQIFGHIGIQKKWYKLSKLVGGGQGNLDKIQKNIYISDGLYLQLDLDRENHLKIHELHNWTGVEE